MNDLGRGRALTDPSRLLPALAVLTAALAASPLLLGAEPFRLESRLKPESDYYQTISMQLNLSTEMSGLPADQAAAAGALTQGMTQEMEMALVMAIGPLENDGAMSLDIRLEGMKSVMTVAGQRIEAPVGAEPGTLLMSGRITPQGKMFEMHAQEMGEVPSAMLDQLSRLLPQIPDTTLRVGESFEIPMSMPIPLEGMSGGMEGRAIYTLVEMLENEARFDVQQTFAMGMEGGASLEKEGMRLSVNGGGDGSAVFDVAEGIFTRLQIDMKLTANVEGASPAMASAGEAEAPAAAFKVKVTASGPVAVTVSRRPSAP